MDSLLRNQWPSVDYPKGHRPWSWHAPCHVGRDEPENALDPEVADYCVVVLVGDDGSVRWADSAHRDPSKRALLEGLRGYIRPFGSPEHPVETALRTGEPQLVADAGGQLLKWGDGASLSLVRGLAPTSYIAVPMAARRRTFGAILFAVTAE